MKTTHYKGSLETIVLHLLHEHKELYGYEITKIVKEKSDESITLTEGALYPILHGLEAKGIIESFSVKVDNRYRKYYKLTESGTTEYLKEFKIIADYIDNLQKVLNLTPKLA